MIYLESRIPEKVGYVLPIGDLHFGDPAFKEYSKNKLKGYIKWVKENPNSRVVLGGDLFNVATRTSPTQPFNQQDKEFDKAVELFEPIKSQIVGAIDGNHEYRLIDFANFSIMNVFCQRLGIAYMGISGVVNFKVHKELDGFYRHNYFIYFHHTTGGGATQGGKINRTEKLASIVEGCDVYCSFHSHGLIATPRDIYYPTIKTKGHELMKRRVWFVCCGSYLEYSDSYAERKMLPPQKLGSPRIRLEGGKKHDVHLSL